MSSKCWACSTDVPPSVRKCTNCGEWQDWRRHIGIPGVVAGAIAAISAVIGVIYTFVDFTNQSSVWDQLQAFGEINYFDDDCRDDPIPASIALEFANVSNVPVLIGNTAICNRVSFTVEPPHVWSGFEFDEGTVDEFYSVGAALVPSGGKETITFRSALWMSPGDSYTYLTEFSAIERCALPNDIFRRFAHHDEIFCSVSVTSPEKGHILFVEKSGELRFWHGAAISREEIPRHISERSISDFPKLE